ncbi:MAG: prevent-host-death family protein [Planctomycetes bacterium]|nr:prevent-host-death family protein [Planctomycetota bacterium]
MKASILDLRRHMRKILAALDMNETVTLTYRGKEKAKIVPTAKAMTAGKLQQHRAFGIWADRKDLTDVDTAVRRIRRGRVNAV